MRHAVGWLTPRASARRTEEMPLSDWRTNHRAVSHTRSGSFVEEGAKDGEILQVPIGGDLDGTAETVVDGVDDDSDDAPFGVGDFTENW